MKIGTRGSALALWQAHTVARLIEEAGGERGEIVIIRTSGDEGPPEPSGVGPTVPSVPSVSDVPTVADVPAVLNIKATFVKEIEEALVDGRIDLAVHSSKDLPAELPDNLIIGAALAREDPRDALLLPTGSTACDLEAVTRALGPTPRIGTSSVRRAAELRGIFPAASFSPIRGNVETRLRKLDAGDCDVLVLAVAGLKRLGLDRRISAFLPVDVCVPAPGQGIVAIEIRHDGPQDVRQTVSTISDADATSALIAERAVVRALGGGCQMPLGVIATLVDQDIVVKGLVASLDGRKVIRATVSGNRGNAAKVGEKLARRLLEKGAAALLADSTSAPRT